MSPATLHPLEIPCHTHRLANGLRVVVHEDHSSPLVAVHLMYHVGSRHETPGRTGLAHLLEHLLFEGSPNCPKGRFDRLLEGVGGSNNGSTWLDRTNYYETVPSHAVELALWLERDRMGHFVAGLTHEMLEVQRGVVINERRQAYENRPYGMADERLTRLLFGDDHPYSWPTIGYVPDLEAITLQDAARFFETYYTPRNAVLVLAGDVRLEAAMEMAERYLGDLPSGPDLPRPAPHPAPRGAGFETLTDRVTFPRVYHGRVVPAYGTPDWVALDVLTYVLTDGESARLHRALVRDDEIAQDVDTYLYPTELHGVLGVVATARSEVDGDALREAVERALRASLERPISLEERDGAVRRARRDHLEGLANVEERADELAYAATVLGDATELARVLNSYGDITVDDLHRVATDFLLSDRGAELLVVPSEGGEDDE